MAFVPALLIFGVSANACCIRLSQRRFLDVFNLAASQTRFIHSLQCNHIISNRFIWLFRGYRALLRERERKNTYFATNDRNLKSSIFMEVLISRQPIYCGIESIFMILKPIQHFLLLLFLGAKKKWIAENRNAILTRTLNVTPSLEMMLSACDQPRAGLLPNVFGSMPPSAPSILFAAQTNSNRTHHRKSTVWLTKRNEI